MYASFGTPPETSMRGKVSYVCKLYREGNLTFCDGD